MRFGRSAMGEIFEQGEWKNYTEIWQEKTPLWIDRQCLKGSQESFFSINSLAGKPVIGTLNWIGKPVTISLIQEIRNLWQPQTIIPKLALPKFYKDYYVVIVVILLVK
jgi:urease accessory protein